jgi:sugar phosphate isomerase/epimerase
MRLGGPMQASYGDPAAWVAAVRASGYRAAFCPVTIESPPDVVMAYARAAEEADIVIAEVGVWNSPLGPDETTRRAALDKCKRSLALADQIRARCCVNVAGSRGEKWDGPHPDNLTPETFELIVETVREIIDDVQPARTFYTLETMPWMYPDSPESYIRLIAAIDRPAFAVHLDPVNLIASPQLYFHNAAFIRECFAQLGPYIKSCHAKDIVLRDSLTVHLDEVRPGLGALAYPTLLHEMDRLVEDVPLMLEHLSTAEDYRLAAGYVRGVASQMGLSV